MATTRILYSQTGQTGKMLAQAVNKVLDALAELRRIKALMDRAAGDYAALATELGGGITTQNANDAWTITATALTAIDVDAVRVELERLDQG